MEPTNAKLLEAVQHQDEAFRAHAKDDLEVARLQAIVNSEVQKSLASVHERLNTIATKDDTDEILKVIKSVNVGFGFIRFSWNNIGKLGSMVMLMIGIVIFFKVGIAGVIAFFFSSKLP